MYRIVRDLIMAIYTDYRSILYFCVGIILTYILCKKIFRNEKSVIGKGCIAEFYLISYFFIVTISVKSLFIDSTSGTVVVSIMLKEILNELIIIYIVFVCVNIIKKKGGIRMVLCAQGFYILCMIQLLNSSVSSIRSWSATWYAMDYSLGFGSRMFIGSILKIFYPNYISTQEANLFVFICLLILAGLISTLMAICIDKVNDDERLACLFLCILYFACPGSFQSIVENYGRLEMYGYMAIICMILWNIKFKNQVILRYIGITLLAIIIVLIHQGNIFLLFPSIMMILLLNDYKEGVWKTKEVLGSVITIGGMCIAFLYMQFCGTKIFNNFDELTNYLKNRTDLPIGSGLHYEYFATLSETYTKINKEFLYHDISFELPWIKAIVTVILLLPLITVFTYIYKKQFQKLNKKEFVIYKNPMSYLMISYFSVLPEFILNVDWGRWFSAICFVQFTILFLMIYYEYGCINSLLRDMSLWIKKYKVVAIGVIIYLSLLDKFSCRIFLPQADKIVQSFVNMLNTIHW